MNKHWFLPLVASAVVLGLLALMVLTAGIGMIGLFWLAASGACLTAALVSRGRRLDPAARRWVPWAVVPIGLVGLVLISREVNVYLIRHPLAISGSLERQAKEQVANQMRDPTSVLFSDVHRNGSTVCGTVNGRNGFGAYGGAVKFIWTEQGGPEIDGALPKTGYENADRLKECFFEQQWGQCQDRPSASINCAGGLP